VYIISIVITMVVKNDVIVQHDAEEDAEEEHALNHLALSHVNYGNLRRHSFNVFLPRKLSEHTENDLKLMLVSLKNTLSVSTVHIARIERELKKRGCSMSILR
jgi:hypothetical protein